MDLSNIEDIFNRWSNSIKSLRTLLVSFMDFKKIKGQDLKLIIESIKETENEGRKIHALVGEISEGFIDSNKKISDLEKRKDEIQSEIFTLDERIGSLKNEIENIQIELDEKRKKLADLDEHDMDGSQKTGISSGIMDSESKVNESKSKVQSGISDNSAYSKDQYIKDNVDDKSDKKYSTAPGDNNVLIEKRISLEKLISVLEHGIQNKKDRSDELNIRLEEKTLILDKMESVLKKSRREMELIRKDFIQYEKNYKEFDKSISTKTIENISAERKEIEDFGSIYEKIKNEIGNISISLSADISKSNLELGKLTRSIYRKQKELDELNRNVNNHQPDLGAILFDYKIKIQNLENENISLKSIIEKNETRIKNFENKILEQNDIIENNNIHFNLEREALDLEDKQHLKNEIVELKAKKNEYESQLSSIREINKNMKKSLNTGMEDVTGIYPAEPGSDSSVQEYIQNTNHLNELIKKNNDDILQLKSINTDLLHEIEKYREQVSDLSLFKQNAINTKEKKNDDYNALLRRKIENDRIILELEKVNSSLTTQISKRDNMILELENLVADLKEKIKK